MPHFRLWSRKKAKADVPQSHATSSRSRSGEQKLEAPGLANAPELPSKITSADHHSPVGDQPEDLWDRAYELLRHDASTRKLVENYERVLLSELGISHNLPGLSSNIEDYNREKQLSSLVSKKLQVVEEARWKFHVGDRTVEVKPEIDRIIKAVLFAKDFISSAVSSEPHAALAWTGVCVLLPLLVNPSAQQIALIRGLDKISDIICRYTVVEETYSIRTTKGSASAPSSIHLDKFGESLQTNITKLYSKIITYQAEVVCHVSRHGLAQFGRDVFKLDDWDALLLEIQERDVACKDFFSVVDSGIIQRGISNQALKMEKLHLALMSNLERLEHTTNKISMDLKSNMQEQSAWRRSDEESRCLQALYTSNYEESKTRIAKRVPGTCQWFLRNNSYKTWLGNQSSDLLWVTADPGCGKSVLSKSLIENELQSSSTSTTCYFFFKDDNADQRSATKAVCALLHQILHTWHSSSMLQKAVNVFRTHGSRMSESFQMLWDLLLDIAQDPESGQVICVLDALDECEESRRDTIIHCLNTFRSTIAEGKGTLKFLVTSRPTYRIEDRFSDQVIRLAGEDETGLIQQEIDLVIRHRVPSVAAQLKLDAATQEVLERQLLEIEHRTYLWLHLILEDVIRRSPDVKTPKRMKQFLDKIPATVYDAYEHILDNSSDRTVARRLLQIIIAALRPLTLAEMNMALNIQGVHKTREEVDLYPKDAFPAYIKGICGLFVSIHDSKVYLLHQTAKEFLVFQKDIHPVYDHISAREQVWKHSIELETSNFILARICLIYLLFTEFEDQPLPLIQGNNRKRNSEDSAHTMDADLFGDDDKAAENTPEGNELDGEMLEGDKNGLQPIWVYLWIAGQDEIKRYGKRHDFVHYASKYWVVHFGLAGGASRLSNWWMQVCNTKSRRFRTWFQLNCASVDNTDIILDEDCYPTHFNSLMVASFLGHDAMVEQLSKEEQVNAKDSEHRSALWWAAKNGHESTVRLLLDKGAIQTKDRMEGETPLMLALRDGSEELARLLIENGANINSKSQTGNTALLHAVKSGKAATVELLLERGAVADSADLSKISPLSYAARGGFDAIADLLLGKSTAIDSPDLYSNTPLLCAVKAGHEGIVKLLVEKGAAIELGDQRGRTPLLWAATRGHEPILKILLEEGAAPNSRDKGGNTPFSCAATEGHGAAMKILLNRGAAADSRDREGRHVLCNIIRKFCKECRKAYEGSPDPLARLAHVANSGHWGLVEYLLKLDAQPGLEPSIGEENHLVRDLIKRYQEVVRLLLEHSTDPRIKDCKNCKPFKLPGER